MKTDPRQLRTRTALTEAFLRLLEKQEFVTVTVSKLCDEASVHRTTFYKHAESIEAFAVDIVTKDLDEVATVVRDEDRSHVAVPQVASAELIDEYEAAMVKVYEHVASRRFLYRPLLASQWRGALQAALHDRMQHRVRIALEVFRAGTDAQVPFDTDEITAFISGGLVGTILQWATTDDDDAHGRAQRTQALMPSWWPIKSAQAKF